MSTRIVHVISESLTPEMCTNESQMIFQIIHQKILQIILKWIFWHEFYTTAFGAQNVHLQHYPTTFTFRNLQHKVNITRQYFQHQIFTTQNYTTTFILLNLYDKINSTEQLQIPTTKFVPYNFHLNLYHDICTILTSRAFQLHVYTTNVTPRTLHNNIYSTTYRSTKITPPNSHQDIFRFYSCFRTHAGFMLYMCCISMHSTGVTLCESSFGCYLGRDVTLYHFSSLDSYSTGRL